MATIHEQLVAAVHSLMVSTFAATATVDRGRTDSVSAASLQARPTVNVRRGGGDHRSHANTLMHAGLSFRLEFEACGDDWETRVDALHEQADVALQKSVAVAALCRGLQVRSTDIDGLSREQRAGRLNVEYVAQAVYPNTQPGRLL